jgi:formate/nitrite transporter FocA (FNT family)
MKKDNLKLGLLLGFLAPVIGIFGYYLWKFRLFSLNEFFQVLNMQKSLLSGIISIALIANAILFTLYINEHKDKTAKGIFIATCIYALITLGFKWFG